MHEPDSSFIKLQIKKFLNKERWCGTCQRFWQLYKKYPADLEHFKIVTHHNGWKGDGIRGPKYRLSRSMARTETWGKHWQETWAYVEEEHIPIQYRKPAGEEYERELFWKPADRVAKQRLAWKSGIHKKTVKFYQEHYRRQLKEEWKDRAELIEDDEKIQIIYHRMVDRETNKLVKRVETVYKNWDEKREQHITMEYFPEEE